VIGDRPQATDGGARTRAREAAVVTAGPANCSATRSRATMAVMMARSTMVALLVGFAARMGGLDKTSQQRGRFGQASEIRLIQRA
jgi:hypothetical protein